MSVLWSAVSLGIPLADSGSDVKVAIVTTIGVIIAAGFTALATTLQRDKRTAPPTGPTSSETLVNQYIKGLELDRANKSKELEEMRAVYGHLRDACWERGLDPDDLIAGQKNGV